MPQESSRERQPESLITKVSHRSMATEFVVLLPQKWADQVETVLEALERLDAIESRLTIYRPEGEIARANQRAAHEPVRLSSPTFRLLRKSIEWSERTAGAFDITAGPLVEAWGFTQRSGKKPSQEEVDQALDLVGYRQLELLPAERTLRFARPGMSINLGAIGKGDALDQVATDLRARGINDFLIHGGNSSVIAAGDQDQHSDLGWAVGISHPTKSGRRLGGIWLKNRALATSGSGKQFFHHRGKRYGHVIDPRTGYPAGDLLSLTVIMKSAADADACSTGLFVIGSAQMESIAAEDWFPPLVAVKQAARQDEVEIESRGEIRWVDDSP
jgi:thiamine biosynthesis lipoprotein